MKIVTSLFLIAFMIILPLTAFTETTSRATWDSDAPVNSFADQITKQLNATDVMTHDHQYTDTDTDTQSVYDRDNPLGIGIDLVVYESSNPMLEAVELQSRWDGVNDEVSVYGVVKVNLWDMFKGDK